MEQTLWHLFWLGVPLQTLKQSLGSIFSRLTSEIMLALCPSIHVIFNPGSCVVSKLSQPSMKACLDVTNCKVYSRSLLHYCATISETITYVSFCQRVLSEQSILRSKHFLCSPFGWKPSPRRPRTGSWAQDQPPYKVFEVVGFYAPFMVEQKISLIM